MELESEDDQYNPDGPESDDDNNGCCHWSVTKDSVPNKVVPNEVLNEFGSTNYDNDNDAKPHEIVEMILSDAFVDDCIDATNYHGQNDPKFQRRLGNLEKNEKGRAFIRGFLAIKWHISLASSFRLDVIRFWYAKFKATQRGLLQFFITLWEKEIKPKLGKRPDVNQGKGAIP
eukprot:Seg1740.6 transcript_id=Seg1740.6/GoldUCD/mRNA.D3Y31 product="hypothetical protein" protein_id=Seg1740.6/GoldUCD/D3Y31